MDVHAYMYLRGRMASQVEHDMTHFLSSVLRCMYSMGWGVQRAARARAARARDLRSDRGEGGYIQVTAVSRVYRTALCGWNVVRDTVQPYTETAVLALF